MPKIMRGYKVVRVEGPTLGGNRHTVRLSCSAPEDAALRYDEGVWTTAVRGNGPLAVFNRKIDALRFVDGMVWGEYEVWECEYRPSQRTLKRRYGRAYPKNYELVLWTKARIRSVGMLKYDVPEGTKFASSVRLLRPIDMAE